LNHNCFSSFTGRRYRAASQQEKQDIENNEDKESEDSDSSESEKDTAINAEESTSDFVIDEDYGS